MLFFASEYDVSPDGRFKQLIVEGNNELFRVVGDYAICYRGENKSAIESAYDVAIDGAENIISFIASWDGGEWVYVDFFNGNRFQFGRDDVVAWSEKLSPEQEESLCDRLYSSAAIYEELDKISYEVLLWMLEQGLQEFKKAWGNRIIDEWR